MTDKYILKGKKTVPVEDIFQWGRWFEKANRIVKQENLPNGLKVSTVFLGLDHRFGEGRPLLFETMVFLKDSFEELDMDRYSTWKEAEQGHKTMDKKWNHPLKPAQSGSAPLTSGQGVEKE